MVGCGSVDRVSLAASPLGQGSYAWCHRAARVNTLPPPQSNGRSRGCRTRQPPLSAPQPFLGGEPTRQHKLITPPSLAFSPSLSPPQDGKLDSSTASMAKYWGTDMEQRVVDACLQLHGGYGFMWDYPVCKVYADARVQRIYGGTNEIMKELIARYI